MHYSRITFFTALAFLCGACSSEPSSKEMQNPKEEAVIRETAVSYIQALNDHDIEALANFWADEAIYRNQVTGELVQGKEQIKEEFRKLFEELGDATLEFEVKSVHFPFDDKASEEGIARILRPGKAPVENEQKIIFVKRGDKWLILNVSKMNFDILSTNE